jgi:hypothetical protein
MSHEMLRLATYLAVICDGTATTSKRAPTYTLCSLELLVLALPQELRVFLLVVVVGGPSGVERC